VTNKQLKLSFGVIDLSKPFEVVPSREGGFLKGYWLRSEDFPQGVYLKQEDEEKILKLFQ